MLPRWTHVLLIVLLALIPVGCGNAANRSYDVEYLVEFFPNDGQAQVTLKTTPGSGRVKRINFHFKPGRYSDLKGNGKIENLPDNHVLWTVPKNGGQLRYRYKINHQRKDGGFDARITKNWVIVRGDDLFPPVKVVTTKDTDSSVRLKFKLPAGWTDAETPYALSRDRASFVIVNPARKFDRPVGWIIAGDIGTRREYIDGVELVVSAPRGEDMRRMDIIAFSNLIMPKMRSAFINLPPKILIVGAGDPMWRGGLSGPRSMWLHADRPIVSENATSSLVHEMTHVVTRIRGFKGSDWITEGMAEFYSLELMRRAGILTERRFKIAKDWMKQFGAPIQSLRTSKSSGARTARAVTLLMALDAEIRKKTDGAKSIDDVAQKLMALGKVSTTDLREISEKMIGGTCDALNTPLLAEAK